jgi:hypothetical protein
MVPLPGKERTPAKKTARRYIRARAVYARLVNRDRSLAQRLGGAIRWRKSAALWVVGQLEQDAMILP